MPGAVDGWEIYSTPLSDISPANWMPRSQSDLALVQGLERDGFAKVGELFDVRQGIRAGHACFVINQDEFDSLQTKERPFLPAIRNERQYSRRKDFSGRVGVLSIFQGRPYNHQRD